MHAFIRTYIDPELTGVLNYTIGQFGGQQGQVTPAQIRKVRNEGEENGEVGSGSQSMMPTS